MGPRSRSAAKGNLKAFLRGFSMLVWAVLGWGAVWFVSIALASELLTRLLLESNEAQGYYGLLAMWGVLMVSPVGLALSVVCYARTKRARVFVACAAPVGLAAAMSPLLTVLL